MRHLARMAAAALAASVVSCASIGDRATIAQLHYVKVEVKEVPVEGGIEKAMQGYERFLADTANSPMAPEAIRRLADLKIEREYGIIGGASTGTKAGRSAAALLDKPETAAATRAAPGAAADRAAALSAVAGGSRESERDFEKRATTGGQITGAGRDVDRALPEGADLERAGAREAIELYKKLLAKYPMYDRKDQVLYHMSRAYEELGNVEEAMTVMNRLVKEHPGSRYFDEVQFRRGEYFFTRKKILDAEDAYKPIVQIGARSSFYELALYKLGWTFYKQELYDDALNTFMTLLDYKASGGFDFEKSRDELEKKRIEDTYRVISLSFSNSGGSNAVSDYFAKRGKQPYEVDIYRNLAEFYLEKRRYNDAALTYKAFVKRDPLHKVAPHFDMLVIDTYRKGGFPKLVIDSTKEFARSYGVKSAYWKHFDPKAQPEVVGYLKQNLRELANHYHALYRDKRLDKDRDANFHEALTWYRESIESFPQDPEAPAMNYQLADLQLENKAFGAAALEYEKTAYEYPAHEKSAAAGYAAVYARREALKIATPAPPDTAKRDIVRASLKSADAASQHENAAVLGTASDHVPEMKRDIISSSVKFADTFPRHEKAAVVLGAAAEDLYEMKDYERAIATARKLIDRFPESEQDVRRAAWLVMAHAWLELGKFEDAEQGYGTVLELTAANDKTRAAVIDNLAASIYKQGEQAAKREDHKTAAKHYLRIAKAAPSSKIRPVAEYDGATALLQLKQWDRAVEVLQEFRKSYPANELKPQVTKKIAFAYKEAGQLAAAAAEYERIETETKDNEQRRGALSLAAELHEQAGQTERALKVYRRYIDYFPRPLDLALEARHKVARLYQTANDTKSYVSELKRIVEIDARAGSERTDRTRYLAAVSVLGLTEPLYDKFVEIKLVKPFQKNLARKKAAMKEAIDAFGKLANYGAGDATAGATFYIAEIYYHFNRALMESERPDNLNAQEREQYELALEEQAFPFEEKAISVHEKNIELLGKGVYNPWIDKSLGRLAKLSPARYAKFEDSAGFIDDIGPFRYGMVTKLFSPTSPVPYTTEQME